MKRIHRENGMADGPGTLVFGLMLGALGYVIFGATGCAGVEVGGKVGLYRVDERQESQRTHRNPIPWKCYFTQCAPEEVQGS